MKSKEILEVNFQIIYHVLTHYYIIAPFDAFEIYHVFENIMENGAFALLDQMLHFP